MSRLSLHVRLSGFLVGIGLLASFCALGQRQQQAAPSRVGSSVVDDSTRNVYGPITSKWTTEKDLFENRPNFRPLDTLLNNYHRWVYTQRLNYTYKDLGVMGTALSSIYPLVPTAIGASSGFQVYEPYYATQEPRYYNTKSPFTRMAIVWGGDGRATTHIEFSRNINPRWNFGFNYRPILVDKQIQRTGKGDRQTVSHYYDFFTSYISKNERYMLLFNFRRIRHRVNENGGVALQKGDSYKGYFSENAQPYLLAAQTEDYRSNVHFFQSFQLAKPFQIYLTSDFYKQENVFRDDTLRDRNSLFHRTEVDSAMVNDKVTFSSIQQEGGIKGNAGPLFYSAYYKFRKFDYSCPYLANYDLAVPTSGVENYLGGRLSLKLDSLNEISGSAEYMLAGFYKIEGQIQTPWLEGYFKNSLSKPGYMQMVYRGSHDYWNNSFDGTNTTQAQGFLKLNKGPLQLAAGGTFTFIHNYIYFVEDVSVAPTPIPAVLAHQSSGNQSTFAPEVRMTFEFFKHLYFRPQVIYNSFIVNDDQALKIPDLFVNTMLTYENHLFKRHLQLQTGLDIHWQSTYQGLGYSPVIQQFYVLKNESSLTVSPAFPQVDVFFTGKMRRARFFFKYHNLVQAITQSGYMPTPGYPGQKSLIDFGFDFLLFD